MEQRARPLFVPFCYYLTTFLRPDPILFHFEIALM